MPGAAESVGTVIDDDQMAARTCDGRVKPTVKFKTHAIGMNIAHVDKHGVPLAALGFVTCHRIGELDL